MLLPSGRPSYHGGYARTRGDSAYPDLWRGLRGAFIPEFGPSGLFIPNLTQQPIGTNVTFYGNYEHNENSSGTLDPWEMTEQGPTVRARSATAGTNNGIGGQDILHLGLADALIAEKNVTIIIRQQKTDSFNRISAAFGVGALGFSTTQCGAHVPYNDGTVYWDFGGNAGAAARLTVGGLTVTGVNTWAFRAGDLGLQIFQNGELVATSATAAVRTLFGATSTQQLNIFNGAGPSGSDNVVLRAFLIYARNLSTHEIKLLSKEPWLPFTNRIVWGPASINNVTENCNNNFGFTCTVDTGGVVYVTCENDFGFVCEVAPPDVTFVSCTNSLGLTCETGYNYEETLIQYLGWTGRYLVTCGNSMFTQDEEIDHGSHVWISVVESCDNTFGWVADVRRAFRADDVLGWSSIVVASQVENITQEFGFESTVTSEDTDYDRPLAQSMLRQGLTYTIRNKACLERQYAPQIAAADPVYGDVPASKPALTPGSLTLTHPVVAPTLTVVVKNPEFGNTDEIRFRAIDRLTRGGDRIIFGDPSWDKPEVLEFTIERICATDIDNVAGFINQTIGLEIGLQDWTGQQWTGVIVAPNSPIAARKDGFSIKIQFQGVKV